MNSQHAFTPQGIAYRVTDEQADPLSMPFPLPESPSAPLHEDVRQLEALWLEDRLVLTDDGLLLPWSEVYNLEEAEAASLRAPREPLEDLVIEVETSGVIRGHDFGLTAKLSHPELGVLMRDAREGAALTITDPPRLVPKASLPLFEILDRLVPRDLTDRLLLIGEAKGAARACGARIDYYLDAEDVAVPGSVGIDVEVISPDEIRLTPHLEGVDPQDAPDLMGGAGPTKPSYTKVDGTKRKRIVLRPEQAAAVDNVKSRRVLQGPDVPRFFRNPEAFVSEDVDLATFSRRVKGLIPRTYTSQPYVRAQRKGRDWFSISTNIELAPEEAPEPGVDARDSRPEDEEGAVAQEGTRRGPPTIDESVIPSITPEEYADLCRTVLETGDPFVQHGDSWIEIDPLVAERHVKAWEQIERDEDGDYVLPSSQLGYVLDVISNLDELEYDEEQGERQAAFLESIGEFDPPSSLQATLMPHQLTGYRWLRTLEERRLGGLLADDMGVGKTVQVIALLAFLAERDEVSPTLLVLPSALVRNWISELRKFCPSITSIYEHTGQDRERNPAAIEQADVVLTTYQTLLRDQLIMGRINWKVVAADEAQYVKNPTAQSTSVLKAMKAQLRLALTGTPVENGLSELWCIMDFVQPGRLGSQKDFRATFETPLRDAESHEERIRIAHGLQERLVPHYIRRLKDDILEDLPRKKEPIIDRVPMGERQKRLYRSVVYRLRAGEMIPLQALQHLLQICSHPELHELQGSSAEELVQECPKLAVTLRRIEDVKGRGEKVLVFTRLRKMQQFLQELLESRLGTHAPILNGETLGQNRIQVVDRFNARPGFSAMILGPEAAGVGLNITGANHVIHYTRLWNPAKENQATDRVHRIGQIRPVHVYYPIVMGDGFVSVEERLDELLRDKLELARNVVWPRNDLSVNSELHEWLMNEPAA